MSAPPPAPGAGRRLGAPKPTTVTPGDDGVPRAVAGRSVDSLLPAAPA